MALHTEDETVATPRQIERFARRVLEGVGLPDWEMAIRAEPVSWVAGANRESLGGCYHDKHIIIITPEAMTWPRSEARLTLVHEVAHALLGYGQGHNRRFMRKFAALIKRFMG